MREEFRGGAGLSVLSLWSKHLVYIVYQYHDSFECFIPVLVSRVLIVSVSMVLRLGLIVDAPCILNWW